MVAAAQGGARRGSLILHAAFALVIHANAHHPQALQRIAQPWQKEVVEPLRQVRVQWRAMAQQDAQLAALRERVKALELEAEQQLLTRLEALAHAWPIGESEGQQGWLEGLATEAANLDHDALQLLRVMATST
jgi:uncharacterized coiled-coil protein SlyX